MATPHHGPWEPLALADAVALFEPASFRWWVAGGHALELHLGGVSWRDHDDTDISVCRSDLAALFDLLSGWDLHIAADGVLSPWHGTELDPDKSQNNIWCRRSSEQPWCLDIPISDGDNEHWIYRRDTSLAVPWPDAVLADRAGTPYLAPELQLLFKSVDVRPKDQNDAEIVIPALRLSARTLLASRLASTHPWQQLLGQQMAVDVADQDQLAIAAFPEPLAAGRTSHAWRLVGDRPQPDDLVVRTPIPNSGRALSYASETLIGDRLAPHRTPTATWQLVEIGHTTCSVGTLLPGERVDYGAEWTATFGAQLAATLHHVHSLEVSGFGPLENTTRELRGVSSSLRQGVVDRWFHAPIWPFDGSSIRDHPVHELHPTAATVAWSYEAEILAAVDGPTGLVHSDLHREHLLAGPDGELTGLLDFGDAFVGAIAWDFALLHWYYDAANTAFVAEHYPDGHSLSAKGEQLALAVGLYKLAKHPNDYFCQQKLLARLLRAEGVG